MFPIVRLFGAIACLGTLAAAQDWHFVAWFPSGGQQISRLAGQMSVPTHSSLNGAGPFYLWPGLQATDNSGVYQNVLDSRNGGWWFGSGWCCSNPSLPWGGGETATDGTTVTFDNYRTDSGWISVTSDSHGSANNTFALTGKNFNEAVFAIEIYSGTWTFGPLTFSNVVIETFGGTDTSWCNSNPWDYNGATNFEISGLSATVFNNANGQAGVRCTMNQLVLVKPNDSG